jgi:queuine/archaeosine tRNA-ribosyltransferase
MWLIDLPLAVVVVVVAVDKQYTESSMLRSHRWGDRSLQEFLRLGCTGKQALYGIIQGEMDYRWSSSIARLGVYTYFMIACLLCVQYDVDIQRGIPY